MSFLYHLSRWISRVNQLISNRFLILIYILFSLFDTVFTIQIINWATHRNHELPISFYEQNPVAQLFISDGDIVNLLWYKAFLVSLVSLIIIKVYSVKPKFGRGMAIYSCIATGLIAIYGGLSVIYLVTI